MESWSVNERIRSAPGNGGCGSAIVFVLSIEGREGLCYCLSNAKMEPRLLIMPYVKKLKKKLISDKSRAYAIMRARRMRWLVMVPIHQFVLVRM